MQVPASTCLQAGSPEARQPALKVLYGARVALNQGFGSAQPARAPSSRGQSRSRTRPPQAVGRYPPPAQLPEAPRR